MSTSIFRIAVSGLQAAQAGMATTSHNIANVDTPGYSRQAVLQSNSPGQFTGSGYFGRGVTVDTVLRRYDALLVAQERSSAGAEAHYATLNAQAAAVDSVLGDAQTGLSGTLHAWFAALDALAAQPGDAAARQSAVSAAAALASRVHLVDSALQVRSQGIDQRIETTVSSVNELSRQVADVNRRVSIANAQGHAPNDLLDLRDRLIADLNKLAQVTAVVQSDGAANVFLSNGTALVVGEQSYALRAAPDPFDASRRVVGLETGSGLVQFGAGTLVGGELGGLLAARRDVVDPAIDRLGRLAMALADAANTQHRLGVDRAGLAGGDLFAVATPWLAAASDNTGNASLSATLASAGALTGSGYQITRTGAGWDVVRLADGFASAFAALPATIDGVAIDLASGAAAVGDRFLLRPAREGAAAFASLVTDPDRLAAGLGPGAGDNRNALALAALQSAAVSGGATVAEDYASLVALVGAATHEASIAAQAQGAMATEAHAAVQSVSGVNLDEEAANLMRYQQAYQAAAKVIAAADAMFQSLLEVTR